MSPFFAILIQLFIPKLHIPPLSYLIHEIIILYKDIVIGKFLESFGTSLKN